MNDIAQALDNPFLADIGISPDVVRELSRRGHDAVHLGELGLDRLPDADILALASEQGRIALTHDLGFAELLAAARSTLPSVVTFRLRNMRPEKVIEHLAGHR